MTQNDWGTFAELISRTFALYQRPPLSKDEMRLYFDALADLPIEAVVEGVKRHLRGATGEAGRFVPRPADITLALFGTPEQQAARAWTQVRMAFDKIGSGRSVRFDDPKVHFALAACGGWIGLTWAKNDREPCFRRAYLAAITDGVTWDKVPDHMRGEDELDGGWNWMPNQIVDVKTQDFPQIASPKAQKVLTSGTVAK